jgi:hypothetical protein
MLFNKDYLFIHIPRTAGKCIKSSIIPFLNKPIYLSQETINEEYFDENDFLKINKKFVHFSLSEIKFFHGENEEELPKIEEIKNIIICLRNPLDRIKSMYKFDFLKNSYSGDFESFISKLGETRWTRNIKDFCAIENEMPNNLKFIRFSNLEEDLSKLLNINNIDINFKKHNQIAELTEAQKKDLFKIKDLNKAISNINFWEEWSIKIGLINPITEKDFL